MPDISMCRCIECPLKDNCYRFQAVPNEHYQSYGAFKPDEEGNCDYYTPLNDFDLFTYLSN